MPDVKKGESRSKYVNRCKEYYMREHPGSSEAQARVVCGKMWDRKQRTGFITKKAERAARAKKE